MKNLDPEEGYDAYAAEYRKDHAHLDSFDWDLLRPLIKKQLEAGAKQIIDLGCGDGRVLKRLVKMLKNPPESDVHLEGWDISSGMLAQARKQVPAWVELKKKDLLELPDSSFPHQGFDLALALFVFVHFSKPRHAFETIAHLLKSSGRCICNTFPQKEAPVLQQGGRRFQIEYYDHSYNDLLEEAHLAGLELEDHLQGPWSEILILRKA